MHHLRYVGALLGVVLLLGAPAASAQPDSAAATRLVTAMRIDDVTLLGLRLGLQRGIRDGKTSPKMLECVSKLDRMTFAPVFAQAIAATMSAQEIASSTAFFESAPGRKYIDSGIYQLYDAVGFTSPDPEPKVSEADMQAVTTFSRTPAGDKLLVRRIFDSAEIRGAIGARIQQVLNGCSQ
jgi:hypothetical protein